MMKAMMALAGLALVAPQPAFAAAKKVKPAAKVEAPQNPLTASAQRIADWVADSADNRALPYIIIDKPAATLFLFDAKGEQLATAPVLIGIASGDDATPGIGSKNLAEIGPAEKTTPAGRFLAKFGRAAGNARVLWVDYATSVALHTIPPGNPKDKRRERMLSPGIDDNRITFGCINVPKAIYGSKIAPMFGKKGGYVYILPDTKPIEAAFPALHARPIASSVNAPATK
ncbi:hypothetical protein OVA07_14480 [Novosphingobium sp. SL115]|uniref:hypothetical protein n=1 Tax=Novosphingobium sp. SL115 TaxID=2995150 RepID=UPI002274AB7F|nr:hypothetical protein [Novosphingobium sp. SL115]MCY1672210.1 hypothetical protein [Novosphingobium sp. SL115]